MSENTSPDDQEGVVGEPAFPPPAFVTLENVYFNGTMNNAVVLSASDDIRKLILWDPLSATDKDILTAFIDEHGGASPAPADATHGTTVLQYGEAVGDDSTNLTGDTPATSGYQEIVCAYGITNDRPTGLPDDATAYTATITIDGATKPISIVGSSAQTFADLITQLNTALGGAGVVTLSSQELMVASKSTGASSTVAIVDGTLFSSMLDFERIDTAVPGTNLVPGPSYTATVTIDGGTPIDISIKGTDAQTFADLVTVLTTAIGATATVTLDVGNIVITSVTTGDKSTVAVSNGTLFGAVSGYVGSTATAGSTGVDLWKLFQTTRSPNGALYAEVFRTLMVGKKPTVLPNVPHTIQFTYYDGTEWLYLDDDSPVCGS